MSAPEMEPSMLADYMLRAAIELARSGSPSDKQMLSSLFCDLLSELDASSDELSFYLTSSFFSSMSSRLWMSSERCLEPLGSDANSSNIA